MSCRSDPPPLTTVDSCSKRFVKPVQPLIRHTLQQGRSTHKHSFCGNTSLCCCSYFCHSLSSGCLQGRPNFRHPAVTWHHTEARTFRREDVTCFSVTYASNGQVTPAGRALLKKLIIAQLPNKFHVLMRPKVSLPCRI